MDDLLRMEAFTRLPPGLEWVHSAPFELWYIPVSKEKLSRTADPFKTIILPDRQGVRRKVRVPMRSADEVKANDVIVWHTHYPPAYSIVNQTQVEAYKDGRIKFDLAGAFVISHPGIIEDVEYEIPEDDIVIEL